MNDNLLKPRPYDSAKDFAPITLTAIIPIAFAVNPKLPVATLQELVTLARSKPRKLSYGSSGTGGPHHLAMELFKLAAGVDIVHVPYKGGAPQLNDLIGGHILIGSIGLPPALPHIEAGKLRALAVTDAKRSMLLPMLQTVAESGWPGFEVSYWLGLMAPAGTPRDIIDRLAAESVDDAGHSRVAGRARCRSRNQHARRIEKARGERCRKMVEDHSGNWHRC
jgi:tripartite-type tricarboxylate transporter receptor subunit TctC